MQDYPSGLVVLVEHRLNAESCVVVQRFLGVRGPQSVSGNGLSVRCLGFRGQATVKVQQCGRAYLAEPACKGTWPTKTTV